MQYLASVVDWFKSKEDIIEILIRGVIPVSNFKMAFTNSVLAC